VRRRTTELGDLPDAGCAVDLAEGVLVVIAAVALILLLVFIGIPFLIALGELVVILLLAIAGVVGRVLFRRPWIVDAVDPAGAHHQWPVVGWRASAAARRFIAARIAATGSVPTDAELAAAVMAA
jgi:hypothetical protein